MRIQESGVGSEGSPTSYMWVRHILETHGRSWLPVTMTSLATGLTVAVIGFAIGVGDLAGLGLMFTVLATIALSYSISVRALSQPMITATAKPGALSLRYRSVIAAPTILSFLAFSPAIIVIGYRNRLYDVIPGGIIGTITALALPIIVFLQAKRAFLHISPESIRVTTAFDDLECPWEHMLRIEPTDDRPFIDNILIRYENNALMVHKKTRGFTLLHNGPEWEFVAKAWGVSLNSLLSTLIFLHENPDVRSSLDETQLRAMLKDPAWATQRRPEHAWRCLESLYDQR